jgi:hypothetical protein
MVRARWARWQAVAGGVVAAALALAVAGCADDGGDETASAAATTAGGRAGVTAGATALPSAASDGTFAASATTSAGASGAAGAATPTSAGGTTGTTVAAGGPATTVASVTPLDAQAYGRDVVYTASVAVQVDDVAGASRQALQAVAGVGGFLFGQRSVTDPEPRTELTFKVPPASFQQALDALAGLGRLLDQTVGADDVTDRIVDLEGRIRTAEVSVDRLRGLLDQANDVPSITGLEDELNRRETELETMRGQLRTVQGQVALATITLTLTRPAVPVPNAAVALLSSLAAGSGADCPMPSRTTPSVAVHAGAPVTVCYAVVNRGDTALSSVALADEPLGLETRDLTVVEGSLTEPLAPGGRILLVGETVVDHDVRSAPVVTAVPVGADGARRGATVRAAATARLGVDDSGPGFGDALRGSARALVWVGVALALLAAVVLPFLWVPALGAALVAVRRRRRAARQPVSGTAATSSVASADR